MFRHIIEPGLELRQSYYQDAEKIFAVVDANRDHLRRFMSWVNKTNAVEDTRAFIRDGHLHVADNNGLSAGIWWNDRYIGNLGFRFINWPRRYTELGYWLAADTQGHGIMTKAVIAMVDHAFNAWKLNRVEIRCDPANTRSRAIPKRLGFTEEGQLRQVLDNGENGELTDAVIYGMLADEWVANAEQRRTLGARAMKR